VGKNVIGSIQWPIPENSPIDAKISQISRTQTEFSPKFCSTATGVDRKKCSLQHSMAYPQNPPPYRRKNLADIFYTSRLIANFVPNFIGIATGVGQGKCNWQHSRAHPRKSPYRWKSLLRKPSYSPFCPKFRCHGNGGWSGENAVVGVRWPIPENLPIGTKISQKSLTQANL